MEQTQEAPVAETPVTDDGTSQNSGQSAQVQPGNQPNDPNAFQADYTRKYQDLADQRRAHDAEVQRFNAERNQFLAQSRQQPVQNPQPQHTQPNLAEVFGQEGAQALNQTLGSYERQIQQLQFQTAYQQEEMLAKQKFGAEFDKHTYQEFNQQTGQMENRNRIMDARLSVNLATGKSPTLDQAYAQVAYADPAAYEKQVREKVYAELNQKSQNTPAAQSNASPNKIPDKVNSLDDAWGMARTQLAR